jgi:hypothetical protein
VKVGLAGFALTLALFGRLPRLPAPTRAHPPAPSPPVVPAHREIALPMLPSVARVRVEAASDRILVIQELNVPRGDWRAGDLDVYVAFGSPGPPIAMDARLVSLAAGESEARVDYPGDTVIAEPAPHPDAADQVLIGKPVMAGVELRVKESQLRHAYASNDLAILRVRSLLHPGATSDEGARDVVVRLGASEGLPMTLVRIEVASLDKARAISRAQARLCGPDADPWPLSVIIVPKPPGRSDPATTIAPSLALRHSSDDLCIRWWTAP